MKNTYAINTTIRYYIQFPPVRDANGIPVYGVLPPNIPMRVKEPPHVALANLLPDREALAKFTLAYGGIGDGSETLLQLRDILRKAWEGDQQTLQWMRGKPNRASIYVETLGVRLTVDNAWEGARIMFLLDRQAGNIAKCASSDCPAPYFVRARKGQKFCSRTCAVRVSVQHLRQRQKKAMQLLEAAERRAKLRKRHKQGGRTKP